MIATPTASVVVDTIIVGGGPVGLAVALGLQQRGIDCRVVEKSTQQHLGSSDWSKTFTYSIDGRGKSLMDELGVTEDLKMQSRNNNGSSGERRGGSFHIIQPDGTKKTIPGGVAGDGDSIKLQRSQLLRVLRKKLHEQNIIEGRVEDIKFLTSESTAQVCIAQTDGGSNEPLRILHCRRIIGCDGINSKVREILATKVDRSFRTKSVHCPSANLIFRSIMAPNPSGVSFNDLVSYRGKTGNSATMLSFHDIDAKGDNLRPLSMARRPNYFLYQCETVDGVYTALEEFPQLNASTSISREAIQTFLDGKGVTFPKPTWARRAACVVNGVPIVLMGDSLHCFPPDVGQGLNAGLLDAAHFLHMVDDLKKQSNNFNYGDELWYSKLKAYSEERVREAESVCRLIPAANPWYQYNLHSPVDRIGRYIFTVKKVTESKVFSATQELSNALGVPNVIMRPSVLSLLTRSNPPLVYSDIFRQHRHNTLVLQSMVLIGSIFLCKLFGCDIIRVLFRRLRTASLLQMMN